MTCDDICENEVNGCKELCCCGEYIKDHRSPMSDGHSPVSMHDWYCEGGSRDRYMKEPL